MNPSFDGRSGIVACVCKPPHANSTLNTGLRCNARLPMSSTNLDQARTVGPHPRVNGSIGGSSLPKLRQSENRVNETSLGSALAAGKIPASAASSAKKSNCRNIAITRIAWILNVNPVYINSSDCWHERTNITSGRAALPSLFHPNLLNCTGICATKPCEKLHSSFSR
jgi:hypothetical protein